MKKAGKAGLLASLLAAFALLAGGAESCGESLDKADKSLDRAQESLKDLKKKTTNNPEINAKVKTVELGSSVPEVEAIMGKPDDRQIFNSTYGKDVTYYYGEWQFNFSSGKLDSINKF